MQCEFCGVALPDRKPGAGRPGQYCPALEGERESLCRRGARAFALLVECLPQRPGALVRVLETLETARVDMGALSDPQVRRARAAAFVVASRGRKLSPGSSGKYTRRAGKPAELAE